MGAQNRFKQTICYLLKSKDGTGGDECGVVNRMNWYSFNISSYTDSVEERKREGKGHVPLFTRSSSNLQGTRVIS